MGLVQRQLSPSWPPDYRAHFAWRQQQLVWLRAKPEERWYGALEYYKTHKIEFIEHWGITYDPRNIGTNLPAFMPFVMFRRQKELIQFLDSCLKEKESGLIEKSRDMGATWIGVGWSVHLWRFEDGPSIGWGSRHSDLVDKLGDIDSIFEKIRVFIRWLPPEFYPRGFDPDTHMSSMRIINPETGATITGEIGDNIGRGGRKTAYLKDESSHYAHPEVVEAALTSNTDVPIDISSVHGVNNVFHRRRQAGVDWSPGAELPRGRTRVFVMDWREHPNKTQEWYDRERRRKLDEGLAHLWAQEVDRNYSASIVGTIIPLEHVQAAVDAHIKLGFGDEGSWGGGLDVADEGLDTNALVLRKGSILKSAEEWSVPDPAVTARRAIKVCQGLAPIELQYDCIGVGVSVKSEANRLIEQKLMPRDLRLVPWDAGSEPLDPDKNVIPRDRSSPLNCDFYGNLKAQGWWQLRLRFERTWRAVLTWELRQLLTVDYNDSSPHTFEQARRVQELRETLGVEQGFPEYTWDADQLISISSAIPVAVLRKLEKELSQPTVGYSGRLRLIVNKAPQGTKSPNLADAAMMAFWPVPSRKIMSISAAVLARAAMPG